MKTLKLLPFLLFAFLFCNYTALAQEEDEEEEIIEEVEIDEQDETETITGTFKGVVNGVVVFTYIDDEEEEVEISFDKVSPEAKKMFDLSSKSLRGKRFEVIFKTENIEGEDDDDFIVRVNTIIALKQLS